MSGLLDKFTDWTLLRGADSVHAKLARAIGHWNGKHDCLPRRQGRCPGLEYCHDCEWSEGISRQAAHD
jgi:hypothetical protein